jgi:hypothetical protein
MSRAGVVGSRSGSGWGAAGPAADEACDGAASVRQNWVRASAVHVGALVELVCTVAGSTAGSPAGWTRSCARSEDAAGRRSLPGVPRRLFCAEAPSRPPPASARVPMRVGPAAVAAGWPASAASFSAGCAQTLPAGCAEWLGREAGGRPFWAGLLVSSVAAGRSGGAGWRPGGEAKTGAGDSRVLGVPAGAVRADASSRSCGIPQSAACAGPLPCVCGCCHAAVAVTSWPAGCTDSTTETWAEAPAVLPSAAARPAPVACQALPGIAGFAAASLSTGRRFSPKAIRPSLAGSGMPLSDVAGGGAGEGVSGAPEVIVGDALAACAMRRALRAGCGDGGHAWAGVAGVDIDGRLSLVMPGDELSFPRGRTAKAGSGRDGTAGSVPVAADDSCVPISCEAGSFVSRCSRSPATGSVSRTETGAAGSCVPPGSAVPSLSRSGDACGMRGSADASEAAMADPDARAVPAAAPAVVSSAASGGFAVRPGFGSGPSMPPAVSGAGPAVPASGAVPSGARGAFWVGANRMILSGGAGTGAKPSAARPSGARLGIPAAGESGSACLRFSRAVGAALPPSSGARLTPAKSANSPAASSAPAKSGCAPEASTPAGNGKGSGGAETRGASAVTATRNADRRPIERPRFLKGLSGSGVAMDCHAGGCAAKACRVAQLHSSSLSSWQHDFSDT